MEQADGVGAAADGGDDGSPAAGLPASRICSRASLPITDWKSRTISG